MKEYIDPQTKDKWIELSKDEIRMGFLAQCVEDLADAEGCLYTDMFDRMEAADMTEGYILKHFDSLNTQSWEHVMTNLSDLLAKRESR